MSVPESDSELSDDATGASWPRSEDFEIGGGTTWGGTIGGSAAVPDIGGESDRERSNEDGSMCVSTLMRAATTRLLDIRSFGDPWC